MTFIYQLLIANARMEQVSLVMIYFLVDADDKYKNVLQPSFRYKNEKLGHVGHYIMDIQHTYFYVEHDDVFHRSHGRQVCLEEMCFFCIFPDGAVLCAPLDGLQS